VCAEMCLGCYTGLIPLRFSFFRSRLHPNPRRCFIGVEDSETAFESDEDLIAHDIVRE
jgi:hypothetical protein